jgi:hypothetical protein
MKMEPYEDARQQWINRFVSHMCANAGFEFFDDGGSVADYAAGIAQSYYEDAWRREDGPEDCAESDMDYWV